MIMIIINIITSYYLDEMHHHHESITALTDSLAYLARPLLRSRSVRKHCSMAVAEMSIIERYTLATTKAITPEMKVTAKGELILSL